MPMYLNDLSRAETRLKPKPPAGGIVYLASPYTNHPKGRPHAFASACAAAHSLLSQGVVVYSPIAHGHALSTAAGEGALPGTSEFWLAHCRPFLDAAEYMIVLTDDGWKESRGVTYEIGYMHAMGKPVLGIGVHDMRPREITLEGFA
ncbi:MAG: DUF1937 family protein [Mycobacterium sp.]